MKKTAYGHKTEHRLRVRAQVVLHASRGRSNECIARETGLHLDTVPRWRGRFAQAGLPGLKDRQRCGRPASFTPLKAAEGKALACRPPAESEVPRPEEAVAMYVDDVTLPPEDAEDQWCDLLFHTAQPEVGKNWTDDGQVHEERGLKGRAEDDTRAVPGPSALTRILREHIKAEDLKPGDHPFRGEFGGILAGSVTRRAWGTARKAELAEREYESPMGRRIYDIRHTRLTKWINDGIPPAQVAYGAGHSVPPLLLAFCAGCIEGQLPDLKRRLEAQGDLPELPEGE
ncbi:helix-turn-helix domain-containing protein [Streptomyces sp. NPDC002004]